jgi:hypothetical protein
MARLHREGRYDRMTTTVAEITGRPAQSVEAFVAERSVVFASAIQPRSTPSGR